MSMCLIVDGTPQADDDGTSQSSHVIGAAMAALPAPTAERVYGVSICIGITNGGSIDLRRSVTNSYADPR